MIGSMVWDTIHGRDPARGPVEEWGGVAYALAALDATLPEEWEVVPLIKVGRDLAPRANAFLRTLRRPTPDARFIEVPEPNNRVTLRYVDAYRRTEHLRGGVPPWTWAELGPMVRDLDALYVNFISGFEISLETAQMLRRVFPHLIYADLHSLFLGLEPDGTRPPQGLPDAPAWFGCFDVVQVNEDEMAQLGADLLAIAAGALGRGCRVLCVTLAQRGAAYFTAGWRAGAQAGRDVPPARPPARLAAPTIRTGRIAIDPAEQAPVAGGDPTGCGDVFGAAACAALVSGASVEDAFRLGVRLAARNVTHRGATGLRDHLLGRLSGV